MQASRATKSKRYFISWINHLIKLYKFSSQFDLRSVIRNSRDAQEWIVRKKIIWFPGCLKEHSDTGNFGVHGSKIPVIMCISRIKMNAGTRGIRDTVGVVYRSAEIPGRICVYLRRLFANRLAPARELEAPSALRYRRVRWYPGDNFISETKNMSWRSANFHGEISARFTRRQADGIYMFVSKSSRWRFDQRNNPLPPGDQ